MKILRSPFCLIYSLGRKSFRLQKEKRNVGHQRGKGALLPKWEQPQQWAYAFHKHHLAKVKGEMTQPLRFISLVKRTHALSHVPTPAMARNTEQSARMPPVSHTHSKKPGLCFCSLWGPNWI